MPRMYIRQTKKIVKGQTYINHLLVESVSTPNGPRQRTVCSLGDLSPRPRSEWLRLAQKIETALAGQDDWLDKTNEETDGIVRAIRQRQDGPSSAAAGTSSVPAGAAPSRGDSDPWLVRIHTDRIEFENAREAGPLHVGWEFFKRLGLPDILSRAGLDPQACLLAAAMTLNRLICPASEHAMPDWFSRTALCDLLGEQAIVSDPFPLYRLLDKLHPKRAQIEAALVERERELFNLDATVFLYDLTSTYFEGQADLNPKAKRGYSRDSRPDAKQVVVGLVVNRDGFPLAHEVFAGNRLDCTTVDEMLDALGKRVPLQPGQTVVVDRGMAGKENIASILKRKLSYIVAARQSERDKHLAAFEDPEGYVEVIREPSPRNPAQKKSRVRVKQVRAGEETHVLCLSDGRRAKDRAIRDKHENRLLADVERLKKSVASGRTVNAAAVHQRLGRIKERYPRVARYYRLEYDETDKRVRCERDEECVQTAQALDGAYLLRTNRHDLSAEEFWRIYLLLTRAENAFRCMKSPLAERPIFHHLEHRVETHIFLCVLAYHLLAAIERTLLDQGVHTSWASVREILRTRQINTILLPSEDGWILKIRQATKPEPAHVELYKQLAISGKIIPPRRTWIMPGGDE